MDPAGEEPLLGRAVEPISSIASDAVEAKFSIYALTPHKSWLTPSWSYPKYGGACLLVLGLCFLPEPNYQAVRLGYSAVAAWGLLFRVCYYARKEWLLYFIDLCFVNSILLVWSMWWCTEETCSPEWRWALFLTAQGPVAGATFLLQTPLTLHHPEGFESFFLHASPMWVTCAVRWRMMTVTEAAMPSMGSLMWAGISRIYLPWVSLYIVFLLLQPMMPEAIAGYETLMDLWLFPSRVRQERLEGKRKGYLSYIAKLAVCVFGHFLLSLSGFAAAAFSYRCLAVQVVWVSAVLIGCVEAGWHFYHKCADPDHVQPSFMSGFWRMGLAWAVLLSTNWLAC